MMKREKSDDSGGFSLEGGKYTLSDLTGPQMAKQARRKEGK